MLGHHAQQPLGELPPSLRPAGLAKPRKVPEAVPLALFDRLQPAKELLQWGSILRPSVGFRRRRRLGLPRGLGPETPPQERRLNLRDPALRPESHRRLVSPSPLRQGPLLLRELGLQYAVVGGPAHPSLVLAQAPAPQVVLIGLAPRPVVDPLPQTIRPLEPALDHRLGGAVLTPQGKLSVDQSEACLILLPRGAGRPKDGVLHRLGVIPVLNKPSQVLPPQRRGPEDVLPARRLVLNLRQNLQRHPLDLPDGRPFVLQRSLPFLVPTSAHKVLLRIARKGRVLAAADVLRVKRALRAHDLKLTIRWHGEDGEVPTITMHPPLLHGLAGQCLV